MDSGLWKLSINASLRGWWEIGIQLLSSACDSPFAQLHFLMRPTFLQCVLSTFMENQLIAMNGVILGYSALFHWAVYLFLPRPRLLITLLWSQVAQFLCFFFFLQDCFGYFGSFVLSYDVNIIQCIHTSKAYMEPINMYHFYVST